MFQGLENTPVTVNSDSISVIYTEICFNAFEKEKVFTTNEKFNNLLIIKVLTPVKIIDQMGQPLLNHISCSRDYYMFIIVSDFHEK